MKRKIFVSLLMAAITLLMNSAVLAQINNPKETIKNKATDRANSRIDQGIDAGFDKIEEGAVNIFKFRKRF